jgi:hypothetical protein
MFSWAVLWCLFTCFVLGICKLKHPSGTQGTQFLYYLYDIDCARIAVFLFAQVMEQLIKLMVAFVFHRRPAKKKNICFLLLFRQNALPIRLLKPRSQKARNAWLDQHLQLVNSPIDGTILTFLLSNIRSSRDQL